MRLGRFDARWAAVSVLLTVGTVGCFSGSNGKAQSSAGTESGSGTAAQLELCHRHAPAGYVNIGDPHPLSASAVRRTIRDARLTSPASNAGVDDALRCAYERRHFDVDTAVECANNLMIDPERRESLVWRSGETLALPTKFIRSSNGCSD